MLNLNLLPPQAKLDVRYVIATRIATAIGVSVAGVGIIALILLLPSIFFVDFQKSAVISTLEAERLNQEQAGIADEIRSFRELDISAGAINREVERGSRHTAIIEAVVRAAPRGIRLDSIRIQLDANETIVSGHAPTRALLLAYLESLREHPRITKVSSPVQNLVRDTDIKFSVTITPR